MGRNDHRSVIAVAGMAFEARLARGPNIRVLFGQDHARLAAEIDAHARSGAAGIISFGIAGGLAPFFRPGDVLVAASVLTREHRLRTCPNWSRALLLALPSARLVDVAGVDTPVLTVEGKSALWHETGAAAVDMESHLAAEAARRHGLPFAVLRVIVDPAERAIPSIALAGVRPDGKTDAGAIIKALRREPRQLRTLLRLASDAQAAGRSLMRGRKALGPLLGFLDAGKIAPVKQPVPLAGAPILVEDEFGAGSLGVDPA